MPRSVTGIIHDGGAPVLESFQSTAGAAVELVGGQVRKRRHQSRA
jgi:hypothetical protein